MIDRRAAVLATRRPRPSGLWPRGKRGSKYHIATDGDGAPVACAATAAEIDDILVSERLFLAASAVMARTRMVFADKGSDAERHRDLCRRFGAAPHIHKRGQPHGSGLGGRRRPVERSNAWVLENGRLALRYDRLGFIVQSLMLLVRPAGRKDYAMRIESAP